MIAKRSWTGSLLATFGALLGGCSYSMPFARTSPEVPAGEVVVALTEAKVALGDKPGFVAVTRELLDAMPEQAGLIGYAIRFEILGDRLWTMTAWRDDASVDAFVSSVAHRRAMDAGADAMKEARFHRLSVSPAELPLEWSRVEALLEAEGWRY